MNPVYIILAGLFAFGLGFLLGFVSLVVVAFFLAIVCGVAGVVPGAERRAFKARMEKALSHGFMVPGTHSCPRCFERSESDVELAAPRYNCPVCKRMFFVRRGHLADKIIPLIPGENPYINHLRAMDRDASDVNTELERLAP